MKIIAGKYPEEKDIDKWVGFLNNGNCNIVFLWRYAAYCRDIIQAKNIADVGLRDTVEQARLYQLYLAGKGNIAAAPGTSWHEFGFAIDLNRYKTNPDGTGQYYGTINADYTAWLNGQPEVLNQYGLSHAVRGEIWHIQPIETIGVGGDKSQFADPDDYLRSEYKEPVAVGMKKGDENEQVKTWQVYLNRHGATLDADGDWGNLTEAATVKFLSDNAIPYSGVVDIGILLSCAFLEVKAIEVRDNDIKYLNDIIGGRDATITSLLAKDLTSADHIEKLGKENEKLNGVISADIIIIEALNSDINKKSGFIETLTNENARLESDNAKLSDNIATLSDKISELSMGKEKHDALINGTDFPN